MHDGGNIKANLTVVFYLSMMEKNAMRRSNLLTVKRHFIIFPYKIRVRRINIWCEVLLYDE